MQFSSELRTALVAVLAFAGVALSSTAFADSGSISFKVIKAGFVVGGSGGSGTPTFDGPQLPDWHRRTSVRLHLRRLSETRFHGTVSNIHRASPDVAGVYAAGNVGAAVGRVGQAIVLTNQNGAVSTLTGKSVGSIVSADLNGLALTVK